MGRECDSCDRTDYTVDNPRVFVCMPRPSDPSEMCCVLAGHKSCMAKDQPVPSISDGGVWQPASNGKNGSSRRKR